MLFKFASYLLGTNTEQDDPQLAAPPNGQPSNQPNSSITNQSNSAVSANQQVNGERPASPVSPNINNIASTNFLSHSSPKTDENHDELIYDEQFVQSDDRPERLEDSLHEDDEQWIYITPITRPQATTDHLHQADEQCQASEEENSSVDDETTIDDTSDEVLDVDTPLEQEKFNFYDYFNPNVGQQNHQRVIKKLEESWVIHPPACFQVDNTFAIEQHPLENLFIEQPAPSVIHACRAASDLSENKENKENTRPIKSSPGRKQRKSKQPVNTRKRGRIEAKQMNKTSSASSNSNQNSNSSNNSSDLAMVPSNHHMTSSGSARTNGPFWHMMVDEQSNAAQTTTTAGTTAVAGRTLATTSAKSSNRGYRSYRRENFTTRPFTIHRKLC